MFRSNVQKDEPGLRRLQQDVSRDRLRVQQRMELFAGNDEPAQASGRSASGRLYQVFVAMGEA